MKGAFLLFLLIGLAVAQNVTRGPEREHFISLFFSKKRFGQLHVVRLVPV